MERVRYGQAIRYVQTLFDVGTAGGLTDGQLLERFLAHDAETAELAFAALFDRHAPMVLRVCRVILYDEHDALDACQASFLVLVHRARTLRIRESLGPWLHQVALRVASYARRSTARRRRHERIAAELADDKRHKLCDEVNLASIIHDEIERLPERYRQPVVLCILEGLSREQAARQLRWPLGTPGVVSPRGRAIAG